MQAYRSHCSILRGGSETHGWSLVNDFEMEDRRNRLPVSYVHSLPAWSHRPHFGCLPSPVIGCISMAAD